MCPNFSQIETEKKKREREREAYERDKAVAVTEGRRKLFKREG